MLISARHFVYAPDLAERFDTWILPLVIPTTLDGLRVVDYSRPGLQTYVESGLQFELAAFPEEDDAIEGYLRWYRPGSGETIFDVGCSLVGSLLTVSPLVGDSGRVVAFEPDPLNYSLLLRNIARHQLKNVVPVKTAVSLLFLRPGPPSTVRAQSALAYQGHSSRATIGKVEMVGDHNAIRRHWEMGCSGTLQNRYRGSGNRSPRVIERCLDQQQGTVRARHESPRRWSLDELQGGRTLSRPAATKPNPPRSTG